MALRETLAAVLGVGLGLVLLAYPQFVLRAHAAGRLPDEGEYGSHGTPLSRWQPVVRVAGGGCVLAGLYFAAATLGAV